MNDPRGRPTLFVPLVGIPALIIFCGGGIGYALMELHAAEQVKPLTTPVAWLADKKQVPNGTFVEVEATFASGGEEDVHLDDAPDIVVGLEDGITLGRPVRVRGRVCDSSSASMCRLGRRDPRLDHRGARIFAVGMTPDDVRANAPKGWLFAFAGIVLYVVGFVVSRRRRKGPSRVVKERAWSLPYAAEEIAARLRGLEDEDRFLVVEEGPGRLVFIQGYSENAARGWGIRKMDVFPRRATLTWKSSPREPVQVAARIEEDLVWWPAPLTATMDRLARESIASTLSGIQRVLVVS